MMTNVSRLEAAERRALENVSCLTQALTVVTLVACVLQFDAGTAITAVLAV